MARLHTSWSDGSSAEALFVPVLEAMSRRLLAVKQVDYCTSQILLIYIYPPTSHLFDL